MWEIVKFFLMCVGFCCLVSTAALLYMVYSGDPKYITEELDEDWYK